MNEDKYGPWIAVNPGDIVPTGGGQVQGYNDSRAYAETTPLQLFSRLNWHEVTSYRRPIEPVRGKLVLFGHDRDVDGFIFTESWVSRDNYRLILPTIDGQLQLGDITARIEKF